MTHRTPDDAPRERWRWGTSADAELLPQAATHPQAPSAAPATPAPPQQPARARGVCARCGHPKALHARGAGRCAFVDERGIPSECVAYTTAVRAPRPEREELCAIVDTREPDRANALDPLDRALGLARAPWYWDEATESRVLLPYVREYLAPGEGDYSAVGLKHRVVIEWKQRDVAASVYGHHFTADGRKVDNYEGFQEKLAAMALSPVPGLTRRAMIVIPYTPQRLKIEGRALYGTDVHPLRVIDRYTDRIFLDYGIEVYWAGDEREGARMIGSVLRSCWRDELKWRKARATV